RRADARGLLAAVAVDRHQPRVGSHERIVARQRGERPLGPERGDRAVDEPRVEPRDAPEVESQLLDDARSQALNGDVGARDEPFEDLETALALEIQREALLVPLQRDEDGALAAPGVR